MNTEEYSYIPLTRTSSAIVDACDKEYLSTYRWELERGGYAVARFTNAGVTKYLRMHRLILERKIGRPLSPDQYCDHRNMHRLDNRRDNLRVATSAENMHNRAPLKGSASGYKGVYRNGDRWLARMTVNQTDIRIGIFDTAIEAAYMYDQYALQLQGEFARFNVLS